MLKILKVKVQKNKIIDGVFDSVNEKGELIKSKKTKKNNFWRCRFENLTIDVGNTNILFCLFENKRIIKHERISLNKFKF